MSTPSLFLIGQIWSQLYVRVIFFDEKRCVSKEFLKLVQKKEQQKTVQHKTGCFSWHHGQCSSQNCFSKPDKSG